MFSTSEKIDQQTRSKSCLRTETEAEEMVETHLTSSATALALSTTDSRIYTAQQWVVCGLLFRFSSDQQVGVREPDL